MWMPVKTGLIIPPAWDSFGVDSDHKFTNPPPLPLLEGSTTHLPLTRSYHRLRYFDLVRRGTGSTPVDWLSIGVSFSV